MNAIRNFSEIVLNCGKRVEELEVSEDLVAWILGGLFAAFCLVVFDVLLRPK